MSTIEPQEPWASAMIAVGTVDPRREGVASWNRLGEIADVHTSTITGFIAGDRTPSTKTIRKIATALRLPTEVVSGWIRDTRPVRSVYQPPAEADMLTDRQRKALTELIRSMVTDEQVAESARRMDEALAAGLPPELLQIMLAARRAWWLEQRGEIGAWPGVYDLGRAVGDERSRLIDEVLYQVARQRVRRLSGR